VSTHGASDFSLDEKQNASGLADSSGSAAEKRIELSMRVGLVVADIHPMFDAEKTTDARKFPTSRCAEAKVLLKDKGSSISHQPWTKKVPWGASPPP